MPPTYRTGNIDRQKYANIGESDRMTLKFVKPRKRREFFNYIFAKVENLCGK